MICTHKTSRDHIIGTIGDRQLWVCSCCGSESAWTNYHTSYGQLECPSCEMASVDWVACSDECVKKLNGRKS